MPSGGNGQACQLLRAPAAYRRYVYEQGKREARARGERTISYAAWVRILKRVCALERSDPGGNVVL